jgi:L-ascorbate metabolism protein UlaG (beta-lactamase superfamily)
MSMILQSPMISLYLGGDSGYDNHFKEVGEKYGPFDLAVLDNGQYDVRWHMIHASPAEVLQAAKDLRAKRLLPVHSGKFAMANHAWDEPLKTITAINKASDVDIVTPMIGEPLDLNHSSYDFREWWIGVD